MLDAAHAHGIASQPQDVAQHRFAPTPSGSRPVWCVVAALPKAERTAHAELHRRGFQAYLPLITVRLPNRHYRTGPLFPGYLFVRIRLDQPWNPVRYAPGVFALLSVDGVPSICPDGAVEALRAGEAARRVRGAENAEWAPGVPCSLRKGHALEDLPAVVLHIAGQSATIGLMFLGQLRQITVPIDRLQLRSE